MTAPAPPAPPSPPAPPAGGSGLLALRVVGGLVAALVVAGAAVFVVARFFHQERVETAVYTQPVRELSVDASTGDVRVSAGAPGSPVTVRRLLAWSFGTASSAESVTDGRLDIAARCSDEFWIGGCSVGYEIVAPPGVVLRLSTHTGNIDVLGPDADLTLSSHTGNVTVTGARSDRAAVTTSTGNIDLGFAGPPSDVAATASTGNVDVRVPAAAGPYEVRTSTSTGDASVAVPTAPDAVRHLVLRTSTGNIDVRPA